MPSYYYLRRTVDNAHKKWETIGPASRVVLQMCEHYGYTVSEIVVDGVVFRLNEHRADSFDFIFSRRKTSKHKWRLIEVGSLDEHDDLIDFNG
jgi:hypothetical protein